MYKCVYQIAILIALSISTSCQSSKVDQPGVSHVVLCWLTDKSDNSKKAFLASVKSLKDIPAVVSVSCGDIVQSNEPVADNTFDVGFIIKFKSKSDLDNYLTHPKHLHAVREVLKPALKKVVVYDFKSI